MRFSSLILAATLLLPASIVRAATVRIGTLPGLRFDMGAFSVRPGEPVVLIFTNTDEMLHNLVVTQPGKRVAVVEAALALGAGAADVDYVPRSPDVLWATKVVQSGTSTTLEFTAPAALGEYPYVCTFPGHGYVMFGTMFVTPNPGPPVLTPPELPGATPPVAHSPAHDHSAPPTSARVLRMFMPDAGPATIAVQLPNGYSYCWDAGACRFRYAWQGGEILAPAERGTAKLAGAEILCRGETGFPLRTGPDPQIAPRAIEFHGYTLDAEGVPEFEYSVDGVKIRERIDIADGRVTRRFRTEAPTLWFAAASDPATQLAPSVRRDGEFHRLTGSAAREFTVTHAPAAP